MPRCCLAGSEGNPVSQLEPLIHHAYHVDLTSCDREPIHLIEMIQPVGFLIALTADWVITRLSANAAIYCHQPLTALLGCQLQELISSNTADLVRNLVGKLNTADAVERAFAVDLFDTKALFDLAIHCTGATLIIEAEPSQAPGELNAGAMVRSMLTRMQGQASLVSEAARLMQALTGFDRVMIYRFHPDGSGEVIAERVRSGLEPFLGLRYPAEDIPKQARALLIRNPVRLLADTGAEPSPIVVPFDAVVEPLDLSMSTLRAHSKMCIEYLQNMGVGATMTVSLLRGGKLWGLISCHHMSPRHVGFELRTTADLFGQMLSFLLEQRERDEIAAYEQQTRSIHNQLIAAIVGKDTAGKGIAELIDRVADLVPCDGIAVSVDGEVTLRGATPTLDEFVALRRFLDGRSASEVFATDALDEAFAPARDFGGRSSGLLAVPISRMPRDYVVFFRHEIARSVIWAGQPGKIVATGPSGTRLTPRKSFEAWREMVRGQSQPWTDAEVRAAEMLRVTLLEVVLHLTGLTEREARLAAEKQDFLIAELNHRVRNILGLIRGLVAQGRTSAADIDTFASVLGDRVHALARAHDQITAKNWGPSSLETLIRTEAGAYFGAGAKRVSLHGPAVLLQPTAFSTMALVIHELMTNAAKYGALSGSRGNVTIEWRLRSAGDVELTWREAGGPPVVPPTRRGFGTTIIKSSIPHELGGTVTLDYAVSGVSATLTLPARQVVVDGQTIAIAAPPAPALVTAGVSGRMLLVEDNLIIALDAEEMLRTLGATDVAVASNVADALRLIDDAKPSFALLDVNLGSEMSWPVAARLRALGVPYIFATGYGTGIDYPPGDRLTATVTKPYSVETLAAAIATCQQPSEVSAEVST